MLVRNTGCVVQTKIFTLCVFSSIEGRLLARVSKDIFATGWDISISIDIDPIVAISI